jgi:hypothetical protein
MYVTPSYTFSLVAAGQRSLARSARRLTFFPSTLHLLSDERTLSGAADDQGLRTSIRGFWIRWSGRGVAGDQARYKRIRDRRLRSRMQRVMLCRRRSDPGVGLRRSADCAADPEYNQDDESPQQPDERA